MAQQIINVGTSPNDQLGDPVRTAFTKCNDNFFELYSRVQTTPPISLVGTAGDQAGMYAYDSTYFYYCFANYDGSSIIWAQVTQVANVSVSTIISGTSNVAFTGPNGNVVVAVNGVDDIAVFTVDGISVTGNVTANYVLGNGSALTGLPPAYANSNVAAYLPTYSGNISANNISITTGLTVGANITGGNLFTNGAITAQGNILTQGKISATGNIETAGYFVGTFVGNVTGNFVVPGSNTQVIFNTNGNADATGGMTFDTNGPNLLTVLGTISSQGNVVGGNLTTSGNVVGGNLNTSGNVVGGNIRTTGIITATGNITGGNLIASANIIGNVVAGTITATGNITGGNIRSIANIDVAGNVVATRFTGTLVSVVGNVTGGNLLTGGLISATGNVTGNYFLGNGSLLTGIDTAGISNGTSNVRVVTANGNVSIGVGGTSNVVLVTTAGQFVLGLNSVSGNITGFNLFTGGILSATGNVIGGNVLAGGIVSATGNLRGGNLSVTGNVAGGNIVTSGNVSGTLISSSGNVIGGNIITNVLITNNDNTGIAIVNGGSNGIGNIGSSSTYFNTIFAKATSAQYADLAECYSSDQSYEPGTVIMFGGTHEVTLCNTDMCPTVAGVVSTNPAYRMNTGLASDHVVDVALTGRVPCKVLGPVTKGAMMVSAGNGHARAELNPVMGSVIGKAVQSFDGKQGIIEIAVGRL
jgi:hypothetical protein